MLDSLLYPPASRQLQYLCCPVVFVLPCCICVALLYLCCPVVFVSPCCICVALLYLCCPVEFVLPICICFANLHLCCKVVLLCCQVVFVLPTCICVGMFFLCKQILEWFSKQITINNSVNVSGRKKKWTEREMSLNEPDKNAHRAQFF